MKKFVSFVLVLSLGLGNIAFASESKLDKESSEFLFGTTEVNAITLSEQEMKDTKGESWLGIGIVIGVTCLIAGCNIGGDGLFR